MKPLRIFISSPGDVKEERDKARQVIAGLQLRYEPQATLVLVLWEDLAIPATASFQEGIDIVLMEQHRIDIAVFILWSRLGSPLGGAITKADGSKYLSGTEREFDLMLAAYEQSGRKMPVILAYARRDEEGFNNRLDATQHGDDALEELIKQRKLVKRFIRENFQDKEGHNLRAYHSYREPVGFAQRLQVHLRGVIDEFLDLENASATWTKAPYRSLEVFDIQHAPIFCGRDEESCDILQRLRDQQRKRCAFVCIVGASGSGKSSLARAGVAATLMQRTFDDGVKEWRTAVLLPGLAPGDLFLALARALAEPLPELRACPGGVDRFARSLEDGNHEAASILLDTAFKSASDKIGGRLRLLLVLDQMEELWTERSITPDQREKYLQAIRALADPDSTKEGHISVLATLRSDFYPQAQLSKAFLQMKGERGHFDLTPPGPAALQQLIMQPARRAGLRFERNEQTGVSLDERILKDASADPSALPLLQYALAELYERRDEEKRLLTFAAYEKMGGVEGALAKRAAQTLDGLPPDAQAALEEVLPLLVSVDTAGEQNAVRRRAPMAELTSTPARRCLTEALIDKQARFLTTDEDKQTGSAIATLAHEALLRRWERVTKWINTNRDLLRMRARIEQQQAMWEQSGRDVSRLLPSGLPLEEGRRLITASTQVTDGRTREYVLASAAHHAAAELRRSRTRRVLLAAVSGLAVVAVIAAVLAYQGYHESSLHLGTAKQQTQAAEEANARNRKDLHEASMADYAVAVQRIEKDGKWSEGVAHLARALRWEPGNRLAAARLYSTLSFYAPEMQSWPRKILAHKAEVLSAQFSPDGTRIVTTSADKTAQIWDAASGSPIGRPLQHKEPVWSAEFSPDGTRILTRSSKIFDDESEARIWDAASGRPIGEPLRDKGNLRSAQFSPDGTRIATASYDKAAQVWDAATGKPIGQPLLHESGVMSAEFSPNGTRIVTASWDKTARVWDTASGKPTGEPMRHQDCVSYAQFSKDGTRIVTASDDKTARVWDAATGKPVSEPLRHEGQVKIAQFSADNTHIVTVSKDHTARIWDVASGLQLGDPLHHDDEVKSAQFSSDGMRIVTASADKTARVWDASNGQPLGQPLRHEQYVMSAQFSPDDTRIVTASGDRTAQVWDAASGKLPCEQLHHTNKVENAQFSGGGKRIVTASNDGTAQVWDATSGKPVGEPLQHKLRVLNAQFSSDGTRIVTASSDGTAQVWDAATCKPVGEPMNHADNVWNAQFSPDGSRIVTASSDKTARIWKAANGRAIGEPLKHEGSVWSAEFSADGRRILTSSEDKTARVWDAATGNPVGEPLRHEGSVMAKFSPDGSRVVTASYDKTARVWDAASSKPLGEPMRHESAVQSAQFSPDGTRIVTASMDNTARIWDAASGRPIGEPMHHEMKVSDAQFSPDGTLIVTASLDKTARIWDAASGKAFGEPLRHDHFVTRAQFSPDGTRITTASHDNTARMWEVESMQHLPLPVPERMLQRARAIAGLDFDADGQMKTISGEQRLTLLHEPIPGNDLWAKLSHWLALPAAERSLTSDSLFTCRQIAERERDYGTKEGLKAALRYDPTVPLAHLLLAAFEENPQRAAFLRAYDLKRMPDDDILWSKASRSLLQQKAFDMAVDAARKAIALNPSQIAAHRDLVNALTAWGQKTEALNAWDKVLASKVATFNDFCDAAYLAAELNQGGKARAIFGEGEKRFPDIPNIFRIKGKALLLLHAPAEALKVLEAYIGRSSAPRPDGVAALAVSRWQTEDKDGAVADYERLISMDASYADADKVTKADGPDAIKLPMLEVLAETLKRHPELMPKK